MKVGLERKKLEDGRPVSARTGANQTECNGENGEKAVSSSMPVGPERQAWSMIYSWKQGRVVFRPG